MYYLFQEPNSPNPQIKDTDFREYFPAISLSMSWANIKPYIRQAYYNHVVKYIGTDLWEQLEANAVSLTPDDELTELTILVKQAMALYAINIGYPELNIHISDGTVSQAAPDKAMPVSQWAFSTARWNVILRAEKALDLALNFIIENDIVWPVQEKYSHTWIKSSTELEQFIKINGFRAYISMKPYFDNAVLALSSLIGCDTLQDILTNMEEPDYQKAVTFCKNYIAHQTLTISIPRMLTYVEGDSLIYINSAEGIRGDMGPYSKPNMEAIQMLIAASQKSAGDAVDMLIRELRSDTDTFTVYDEYIKSMENTTDVAYSTHPCTGEVIGGVGFF
jgi:hypothetical protein